MISAKHLLVLLLGITAISAKAYPDQDTLRLPIPEHIRMMPEKINSIKSTDNDALFYISYLFKGVTEDRIKGLAYLKEIETRQAQAMTRHLSGQSSKPNLQQLAHWILVVWDAYICTSDKCFLAEMYPAVKKRIDYLLTDCDSNNNLFPEGRGLGHMTTDRTESPDVILYTAEAARITVQMARLFREFTLAKEYNQMAEGLMAEIQKHHIQPIEGLSNQGRHKDKPYVAAGDRTYIIGTMDGMFPDMGFHVKGEMGGLWLHPIKLMDGYWGMIRDLISGKETWLTDADEFMNLPYGNKHIYNNAYNGIHIERFQFCPDGKEGMFVSYSFHNQSKSNQAFAFIFAGKSDLSPVWSSDLINIYDAPDSLYWDKNRQTWIGRDLQHPWFLAVSSSSPDTKPTPRHQTIPENTQGQGKIFGMEHTIRLEPGETICLHYAISGSYSSQEEALANGCDIMENNSSYLREKQQLYNAITRTARIEIPNKRLEEVYNWVKFNTQWLIRDVPEIGRGLSAGLMDYPWWFGCDNSYGVQAAVVGGWHDISCSTLRLLKQVSDENCEGSGQIVHEIATNGVVYNAGNVQETGHFITAAWKVYEWTGDKAFLQELYPYIQKGIHWLMVECDNDKNLFPEGYGIAEVPGMDKEMLDVAVYTQTGLACAAKMAYELGDIIAGDAYEQLASAIKTKINEEFWNPAVGGYHQFFATRQEAIEVVEGSIKDTKDLIGYNPYRNNKEQEKKVQYLTELLSAFKQRPDKKQGWSLSDNYRSVLPMESGIAPYQQAVQSLELIKKTASARNELMSISSGINAVAECRYGRIDEAMTHINQIIDAFSTTLPGSVYEIMPDRGCFTQEWTNYGINIPLIEYIFGIRPMASQKRITVTPTLPSGWKEIRIDNLPIGETSFSMHRYEKNNSICIQINLQDEGWTTDLKIPYCAYNECRINNQIVIPVIEGDRLCFKLNSSVNYLEIKYN